ncbi:MAG: hypothetical protein ABR591_15465, partial [Candidatus Velthaea sp.]
MNQFLSTIIPAPAGSPTSSPVRAGATAGSPVDIGLFRAQFAQRLKTASGATLDPSNPLAANESSAASLEKSIAARLKAGESLADIVAGLAASLATSVALQLGLTDADARLQLKTAFASALAPPGQTGPPLAMADQARALAQRFAAIANTAARVASTASGQLNRIVGTILDAKPAKDTPAPAPLAQPDTAAASAFAASPPLANSVSIAAAAASDGRTVSTNPAQAIATGGDTPLGRILARAANAAEQRQSVAAESGGTSLASAVATRPIPGSVLATFLQSFCSALATDADGGGRANGSDDGSFAALLSSGPASADAPAFAPVVPPFAVDATQPASQNAAAPAPHPAVPDADAIVDQVLRGAFMRNLGQSNEMRLQLVPEHLGDVTVKLIIDGGA